MDVAAGYSPGDWPEDFVSEALPRVAESFAGRDDMPPCVAWADGAKDSFRLGPEQAGPPSAIIRGQPADLLAWLLGRDDAAVAAKRERLAARGPLRGFVGTVSEAIDLIGQYQTAGVQLLINSDYRNDMETHELFASEGPSPRTRQSRGSRPIALSP